MATITKATILCEDGVSRTGNLFTTFRGGALGDENGSTYAVVIYKTTDEYGVQDGGEMMLCGVLLDRYDVQTVALGGE